MSIPAGEAASIGTYQVDITMPEWAAQHIEGQRDGGIVDVWLETLGPHGIPHLIIWMASAGSSSYGTLAVYEQQEGTFAPVQLAPLTEGQTLGYRGHEAFEIKQSRLIRRFPICRPKDPNAPATGGEASFRYSFSQGRWIRLEGESLSPRS